MVSGWAWCAHGSPQSRLLRSADSDVVVLAVVRVVLLPMTKAAIRALDTVHSFIGGLLGNQINSFFTAGGSKRGWTTWLTAAVDTRVKAISPIVMDMLNFSNNVMHMYEAYGGWTFAFQVRLRGRAAWLCGCVVKHGARAGLRGEQHHDDSRHGPVRHAAVEQRHRPARVPRELHDAEAGHRRHWCVDTAAVCAVVVLLIVRGCIGLCFIPPHDGDVLTCSVVRALQATRYAAALCQCCDDGFRVSMAHRRVRPCSCVSFGQLLCVRRCAQFFMPDDDWWWWPPMSDMPGELNRLMIANAEHSEATGLLTLVPSLVAFQQGVLMGVPRPSFTWSIDQTSGDITIVSKTKPTSVTIRFATTSDAVRRDFRLIKVRCGRVRHLSLWCGATTAGGAACAGQHACGPVRVHSDQGVRQRVPEPRDLGVRGGGADVRRQRSVHLRAIAAAAAVGMARYAALCRERVTRLSWFTLTCHTSCRPWCLPWCPHRLPRRAAVPWPHAGFAVHHDDAGVHHPEHVPVPQVRGGAVRGRAGVAAVFIWYLHDNTVCGNEAEGPRSPLQSTHTAPHRCYTHAHDGQHTTPQRARTSPRYWKPRGRLKMSPPAMGTLVTTPSAL